MSKEIALSSPKLDKNDPPLNSTPLLAKLEIADKVAGTALAANAQGEDEIKNTILRYKVTYEYQYHKPDR